MILLIVSPHFFSLPSPFDNDVSIEDGVSIDDVEITSHPLWARRTLEDSRVDVFTLELQPSNGLHHS